MNTLNLGSDDEPVKKKKSNTRNLKIALGLAAVILIPTIGSTLAASITIGSANSLEFGQGTTSTAACDSSINITPVSTYYSSGSFALTSISVGSLETSCNNKYLKIKVINAANTAVIIGASDNTYCEIQFVTAGSSSVTTSPSSCALTAATTTGFTFTPGFIQGAVAVTKITIESSDAP